MRRWNEFVALLADHVPGGVPTLALLTVLAAAILALALYFWPHWLPWRWRLWARGGRSERDRTAGRRRRGRFRIGVLRWRLRWRWRRRRRRGPTPAQPLAPDELPDLPAGVLALGADELAAAGRFAEAVRERLRAIVRELVERDVIAHVPGWTVTELARAATAALAALSAPLAAACDTFAEIWYGQRAATRADDSAMRAHAESVRQILAQAAATAERTPANAGRGAAEPIAAGPAGSTGGAR